MTEIQVKMKPGELTEEQQRILQHHFLYQEEADLTEEELDQLCRMFDKPEKLKLLRKLFNVVTRDERGFMHQDPLATIQADAANKEAYAFEVAVNMLADEKVRKALISAYQRVKVYGQKKMVAGFEQINREEFEEGKRTEEFEEEHSEDHRELGENL